MLGLDGAEDNKQNPKTQKPTPNINAAEFAYQLKHNSQNKAAMFCPLVLIFHPMLAYSCIDLGAAGRLGEKNLSPTALFWLH